MRCMSLYLNKLISLAITSLFIVTVSVSALQELPVSTNKLSTAPLLDASIQLGDKIIAVEYANTQEERNLGLMFRATLCGDCGMLFQFEYPRVAGFWMKNTGIPLDIAYIDKSGVITDIKKLFPYDLTSVSSSRAVLYALEMNQDWFKKNDVKVGDKVSISIESENN